MINLSRTDKVTISVLAIGAATALGASCLENAKMVNLEDLKMQDTVARVMTPGQAAPLQNLQKLQKEKDQLKQVRIASLGITSLAALCFLGAKYREKDQNSTDSGAEKQSNQPPQS